MGNIFDFLIICCCIGFIIFLANSTVAIIDTKRLGNLELHDNWLIISSGVLTFIMFVLFVYFYVYYVHDKSEVKETQIKYEIVDEQLYRKIK
jgi:hypothetical protein